MDPFAARTFHPPLPGIAGSLAAIAAALTPSMTCYPLAAVGGLLGVIFVIDVSWI